MSNITQMTTVKGDKEIADDLRKRFFDALNPITGLIGEAEGLGFSVGFSFGKDAFGKPIIQAINLMKNY